MDLFASSPDHSLLNDHDLKGSSLGLRSFSITGDVRVIYRYVNHNTVELIDIGSHNQVYT